MRVTESMFLGIPNENDFIKIQVTSPFVRRELTSAKSDQPCTLTLHYHPEGSKRSINFDIETVPIPIMGNDSGKYRRYFVCPTCREHRSVLWLYKRAGNNMYPREMELACFHCIRYPPASDVIKNMRIIIDMKRKKHEEFLDLLANMDLMNPDK